MLRAPYMLLLLVALKIEFRLHVGLRMGIASGNTLFIAMQTLLPAIQSGKHRSKEEGLGPMFWQLTLRHLW